MSVRQKLIEMLGGEMKADTVPEPTLTGDPCVDEGHDLVAIRAANARDLPAKCRRCGEWFDKDGNRL